MSSLYYVWDKVSRILLVTISPFMSTKPDEVILETLVNDLWALVTKYDNAWESPSPQQKDVIDDLRYVLRRLVKHKDRQGDQNLPWLR